MVDYYRQPAFWGGAGKAGDNIAEAVQNIIEIRRRKRQDALAQARQDALERHQMAQEDNATSLATIAEKRQLASEDFTRRQSAVAEQSANARDLRDQVTFDQQQADRRRGVVTDIGRALGAGRTGQAQAVAAASQFEDPRTHAMQGVQLAPEAPPPAPGPPPIEPKPPEFVGPLEDPDSARLRAIGKVYGMNPADATQPPSFDPAKADEAQAAGNDAVSEVLNQQQQRDRYGQEAQDFPSKNQVYITQKAGYDKAVQNPRYTASFPGGTSVSIDPNEEKKALDADAKEKADRLRQAAAQPGQQPDVARTMMLAADQIEARIGNADKAPVYNMNSAVEAQGFKAGESDKDRQNRLNVARVRSIHKGAGGGGKAQLQGMSELIRMKEDALDDNGSVLDPNINSKIAQRAAELGIPATGKGGWSQPVGEVIRGKSIADRGALRRTGLQATDAQGNALGSYKNPVEAKSGNNAETAYAMAKPRVEALIKDIEDNGGRVLLPEAKRRRESLAAAAATAMQGYNGINKTDQGIKLEQQINGAAGTFGHGLVVGADANILRRNLADLEANHVARQKVRLQPQQGGAPRQAPATPKGKPATMVLKGRTYHLQADGSYQ